MTTIRSPIGVPACALVKSATAAPAILLQSVGPVASVGVGGMLVKLARVRADLEIKHAVKEAADAGRKYINVASETLGG